MSDKYLKEIAKELKLIRKESQKANKPVSVEMDGEKVAAELTWDDIKERSGRQSDN